MWDEAMIQEHKEGWGNKFAGWMQTIANSTASNAFSVFVHSDTNRVLRDKLKQLTAVAAALVDHFMIMWRNEMGLELHTH